MNPTDRAETKLRDRRGRARAVAAAQAGFTLVEMLVVLAIIGLLVGLVAPRVFGQLAEAKVRTAHIQIESFKNALDLFYLDAGRYPTTQEGLQALNTRPANLQNWGGPYIKGTNVLVARGSVPLTDPAGFGPETGRPASSWSRPWRPWPSRFCSWPSRSPSSPPARRRPACSPS